ncbi:response regulator transcription factor [Jatrophihabitans sp.]|uniref:response regulator transcription factor n=1 Tax=Jatrophihabitans sp. TaxID=1932789 RepID=UPI0030C675F6|nr:response regulator transcription factor [Jatrophihabitans sp.]
MSEPTATDDQRPIRIFLLDDHEVVRRGIADLLGSVDGFEIVGEAGTAEEARNRIPAIRPDVAILDARLPDGSGIDVCRDVRSALPDTYCLILTSYDDEDAVLASVLAGASGYVLKEVRGSGLIDAIRQVALGRSLIPPGIIDKVMARVREGNATDNRLAALTEREREVLDLIADGLTNRQIGERLFLAEKTVKNYVSSLLAKLGMERRTQAAVLGAEVRAETRKD